MRRFCHILMSITLILATTGLSISKHYCNDLLIGTTLGTKAQSCGMDMSKSSDCCQETTETQVLNEDFQISTPTFDLTPEYDLLVAYLVNELVAINTYEDYSTLNIHNTGPPDKAEPIYLSVQSFLL